MSEREGGRDRSDDEALSLVTMPTADASDQERAPEVGQGSDAEFERQMEIGRRSMRKHRNVFAALAK